MCIVEVMAAGEKARKRRAKTMERLTGLVAERARGALREHDEALLRARVLTGGVHEMVYDSLARGEVEGISELAEEVVASHLAPLGGGAWRLARRATRTARGRARPADRRPPRTERRGGARLPARRGSSAR